MRGENFDDYWGMISPLAIVFWTSILVDCFQKCQRALHEGTEAGMVASDRNLGGFCRHSWEM